MMLFFEELTQRITESAFAGASADKKTQRTTEKNK
jgi:hypothetical protein